jgi:hypothetical protein
MPCLARPSWSPWRPWWANAFGVETSPLSPLQLNTGGRRFPDARNSRIAASGIASWCRRTIDSGHIAECERFGDLHRRAVSDHFQLLAAISDGGYAASVFGINVECLRSDPALLFRWGLVVKARMVDNGRTIEVRIG